MKKLDYLKLAITNKLYSRKLWMIMAFSVTKENSDKYKSEPYFGRLVTEAWGYSYVNLNGELEKIEDSKPNEPLFAFHDKLLVDNTWLENISGSVETIIGNLLVNAIAIVPCFGTKIKYLTGEITIKKIEAMIAPKLADNPKDNEQRSNDLFYVDEYIKFSNSLQYISSFSQLSSYGATPKSLLPPTGIKEFKKQLLEKYKGKLHDPVELSKFEAELMNFDNEYLKDDPAYGKFLSGKITQTSRKKLYLTIGAEAGFSNSLDVVPVTNSLDEGWPDDPVQFTAMMNGLRSGSFSRGSETVKGGVAAKIILRAANNFKLINKDCGSKLGIRRKYNKDNIQQLVGRYIVTTNNYILIKDIEEANKYIDKNIIVRSPMYCKLEGDNICRTCSGEGLFTIPEGIVISLTDISGTILAASLSAMHGKVLSTKHLDIENAFS